MGLHQNGFRDNIGVFRYAGAGFSNGAYPSALPINMALTGAMRNLRAGEGITDKLVSLPAGARPPYVWMMAQEGGAIKSFRRGNMQVAAVAVAEMGFPRSGTSSITIAASAVGGMIVGATGTATLSIDGTAVILATLNSTGSTTITMDGQAALGAIASLTGTGTVTVDGSAEIMGLGTMTGTTADAGLTPSGIARAVWESLLSQYTGDGTAGKALGTASTGGVDVSALVSEIMAELNATAIKVDVAKVNGQVISGSGIEADPWGPA